MKEFAYTHLLIVYSYTSYFDLGRGGYCKVLVLDFRIENSGKKSKF